ncbi:hypothetical protein [Chitinophaga varians]|uniref:hypothetical protein n=1 Tax=Chitinophaga varians TaxID=2202339 RepID=UPI00165F6721|nr:hypothetical protein [Chitinophaga varians]MBC9912071.1 hypothetical protein [Chitinophaga varians]
MKNVGVPIVKLCLVGCSLLLYFGSFFELRMYEMEYEWIRLMMAGGGNWRDDWPGHVCFVLVVMAQLGILLSIRISMRLTWQLVLASGLVACAIGMAILVGQFTLTLSWLLLGILYAALLVGLIPRAVARG